MIAPAAAKAAGTSPAAIERAAMAAIAGRSIEEAIAQESYFDDLTPSNRASLARTAALFPNAFRPSELGEIPKGWKLGRFSDHARIEMGQSPKGDTYNDVGNGVPLVNGPVEFGEYFPKKSKWTTSPTKLSRAGDLVVCVRGSTTGRFVKSDADYCLGRGVCSIRGTGSQAFVDHLFKQSRLRLLELTTGSTFPNWSGQALRDFRVIRPDDSVVRAFDNHVSPFLANQGSNDQQSRTLAQLRDTLLPKLLSGELTLPAAHAQTQEAVS